MTIHRGPDKDNPSQPAAFRELLRVTRMPPAAAAAAMGVPVRDLAMLLSGGAHLAARDELSAGDAIVDAFQATGAAVLQAAG